jgi:EmrB/QacA subfamily drug resistance transporter
MTASRLEPHPTSVRVDQKVPWTLLIVLLTGQFMALLDVSIVNVALATIATDLHASGSTLQLVVSGYTISYAVLLITSARLGATYGPRRLFRTGTGIFTLSSLLCGLAPNAELLVGARFVQGVGAALMMPQLMSVIQTRFTGAARQTALSAYTAVLSIGGVIGLVLGGVLVTADLFGTDWRSVFLINVPIGLLIWLVLPRVMPADPPLARRKLDLPGLATVIPAVLLLVLPLVLGHEQDWPAWTFVSLAAGVVLSAVFVLVERRVTSPLLDLDVLRSPGMRTGLLCLTLAMIAYGGYLFSMSLHLQQGLGDSPLRAGLTFVPAAVTFGLFGFGWRSLPRTSHPWLTPLGLVIGGLGYVFVALDLRGGSHGGITLLALLAGAGVGFGIAFSPLLVHSLVHVPPAKAPDASGLLTTVLQLSQVVGVAVFGTLFLSLTGTSATLSGHAIAVSLAWMAALMAAAVLLGALLTQVVLRARSAAGSA